MDPKPARNDPCPCGSDKKYKQCCLSKDVPAVTYSIATLKRLLTESGKLAEIWDCFFNLMDREALFQNSRPIPDPTQNDDLMSVLAAVQKAAGRHLGHGVTVVGIVFQETPSEHFYQGTCAIQGLFPPAVVFYFSDIETGSFAYTKDGRSEMFRFSLTKITDPKMLTRH